MVMDGSAVDVDYPPPMPVWGPREEGWLGKQKVNDEHVGKQKVKDEHVSPAPTDSDDDGDNKSLTPTECATDDVCGEGLLPKEEPTESPSSQTKRRLQDLHTEDKEEKEAKPEPKSEHDDELLKTPDSPPQKEEKPVVLPACPDEPSQPSRPEPGNATDSEKLKKLKAAKNRREKKRQRKRALEAKEALRQQKAARTTATR